MLQVTTFMSCGCCFLGDGLPPGSQGLGGKPDGVAVRALFPKHSAEMYSIPIDLSNCALGMLLEFFPGSSTLTAAATNRSDRRLPGGDPSLANEKVTEGCPENP